MLKISKNGYNYEIVDSNKGDINGKFKVMANKEGFENWYQIGYADSMSEAKRKVDQHR